MLNFKTTKKWIQGQLNNDAWGKADALKWLAALGYKPGDNFWVKFNSVEPMECVINSDMTNWSTFITGKDFDGSWRRGYEHKDGYEWLRYRSSTRTIIGTDIQGDELFVLPNRMGQGIDTSRFQGATTIFVDIDEDDLPTQKARIDQVHEELGLTPCAVVFSGGKSYHVYYRINTLLLDVDTWKRLQKRLIVILKGDVTIHNVNREMRFPGFNRDSKQSFQELLFTSDCQYSVEELESKLAFAVPHMSDYHWSKYNRLRHTIKESVDNELKAQLEGEIVALFDKTEEEVKPARKQYFGNASNFVFTELDGEVPSLYYFLSPQYKDLVNSGVTSGGVGREPMLRNIALMLGSAKATLEMIGAAHADDVYNVLTTFAGNCSPALTEFEIEKHYQRALGVEANAEYVGMYKALYTKWVKENRPDVEVEASNNVVAFDSGLSSVIANDFRRASFADVTADEAKELHWRQSEEFKQLEANNEFFDSDALAEAEKKIKDEEWKKQKQSFNFYRWNQLRRYDPTINIHERYVSLGFSLVDTAENAVIFIKSGLGTGKTQLVVEAFEEWKNLHIKSFLLSYRNLLAIQTISKISGLHIHKNSQEFLEAMKNGQEHFSFCMDSLHRWEGCESSFDGKIVIIDEANAVMFHTLVNSQFKNRAKTLKLIRELFRRCGRIIVMDGHLNNNIAELVLSYTDGTRPVIKVENTMLPAQTPITFYLGTAKENYDSTYDLDSPDFENKGIDYNDVSAMEEALLSNRGKFVVTSDSCAKVTALFNLYKKRHPDKNILLITADTSANVDVLALMEDPNGECPQYDAILYSPTAESGIDISIADYFKNQYCYFFNVINASQAKQMIFRIRDPKCHRHVWISKKASGENKEFSDCDYNSLLDSQRQRFVYSLKEAIAYAEVHGHTANLDEILQQVSDTFISQAAECIAKIEVMDKFERLYGAQCLVILLEEAGHLIRFKILENPNVMTADEIKEEKKKIKTEKSVLIYNSKELTKEEYEAIKANPGATPTEKAAATKYEHGKMFPGVTAYKCYGSEMVFKMNFEPGFMSAMKHRWYMNNIDIAKQISNNRTVNQVKKQALFGDKELYFADIKFDLQKIIALHDAGFNYFLTPGNTWHCHSEEVKKFMEIANTAEFQEKIGLQVTQTKRGKKARKFDSKNIIQFINKNLDWFGIVTTSQRQRQGKEKQFSVVSINEEKSFNQYTAALTECLDTKQLQRGEVEQNLLGEPKQEVETVAKLKQYQPTIFELANDSVALRFA
jgi:hypothetical protein